MPGGLYKKTGHQSFFVILERCEECPGKSYPGCSVIHYTVDVNDMADVAKGNVNQICE